MVHHALAPGQSGNFAQRRLYVDLLAFPAGQVPRVAPGAPAAALAEAALYYNDTDLPAQPDQAYLALVRKVGRSFSDDSDRSVLADGRLVCAGLGKDQSPQQMLLLLQRRQLTPFESYVVAIFSTEYLCAQEASRGLNDIRRILTTGS
jgi:hypothetical protein